MFAEIQKSAREGIEKYLGDKTDAIFAKAESNLEKYAKLWQLSRLTFMPTNTVNFLFDCDSAMHGPCVLKICIPGPEVATEINCLCAYDGRGYVKLWEYNLTDGILLLERVTPGDQMWAVTDFKERARLMAQLISDLPIIECEQGTYPTYRTWMEALHSGLTTMGGMEDALFYLSEALRIYSELRQTYRKNCLLHGDMHQENLLLNHKGGYTIIDPKGVVDNPVMETARFLLNETPCEKEKILEIVSIMAPIIGIPEADILKSMYIDAALSNCWTLENHFPSKEAFENEKQKVLDYCRFVYDLQT